MAAFLESVFQLLGYGWAPVILWLGASSVTLLYRRNFYFSRWRLWAIAAAAVAITLGALSTVHPSSGALEDAGLGGAGGAAIAGSWLPLAVVRLAAIAFVVPLALYPRSLGGIYWRCGRMALQGLLLALTYIYAGFTRLATAVGQRLSHARAEAQERRQSRENGRGEPVTAAPIAGFSGLAGLAGQRDHEEPAEPGRDAPWAQPEHRANGATEPNEPPWRPAPAASIVPAAGKNGMAAAGADGLGWRLPSIDLLAPPDQHHAPADALKQIGRLVETTLADHGVRVEVTDIIAGPRIVRFGLVPGWVTRRGEVKDDAAPGERSRVKVQSILTREKDLALAMRTPYLRIEAPVPGEALVGLEVPTPSPSKVHLREVMETPAFGKLASKGGLPVAMGQDTGGSAVALDLAELPHMLIAGATGSGKSVMINSIVASFLLTKTPDQLRILMVDPKRVELTPFNGIPHLIAPVIVDAEEVNGALRGLIKEMLRRYKLMEEVGARNIERFNQRSEEKMPFLVLIVDELADLMMVAGFEVEQNLVRLAQLGRATGIHLVLATQRPSVNVVTGLLKANIPARCAFAVAGQVDSRVILDAVGAEKLMGKGDMLLLHKESPKAQRVQGTLVYDEEVDQMVKFWVNQEGPPLPPINIMSPDEDDEESSSNIDPHLMEQARELAARNPEMSSSFLERRLKIGGSKALEIMEELETEGFPVA